MTKVNYLVTDIAFDGNKELIVYEDFKVPSDVTELHYILEEFGIYVSDELAYEYYVRARLFNNYNMTYNVHIVEADDYYEPRTASRYIVDLNDATYHNGYETATVRIKVPKQTDVTLKDDDIWLLEQYGLEQAVYVNVLTSLPLDITVDRSRKKGTLSARMLTVMIDMMTEDDAADPNHIAEVAVNELQGRISDSDSDDIYEHVFWLASTLVKDVGEYK